MAIQVNGTEVISNSRALNNIASLDATTVAAIGAAGVGGSTVFLGTTAITSDVDYIDITFAAGYRAYRIHVEDLRQTAPSDVKKLRGRFTDSSNNVVSTENYVYLQAGNTSASRETSLWHNNGVYVPAAVDSTYQVSNVIIVYDPLDPSICTSGQWHGIGGIKENITQDFKGNGMFFSMERPAQNNALRIYIDDPTARIDSTSSGYSVWGIK